MMEGINLDVLTRPFLPEQIRQREGRGGKMLDYLETHAVITRLNEAFAGAWSFEVLDFKTMEGEIVVHGKLTAVGQVKAQFGSADIHRARGENGEKGAPVSIGDDLKAAASDALKKCATLFGVGLHLYDRPQAAQRAIQQRPAQQADLPYRTGRPEAGAGADTASAARQRQREGRDLFTFTALGLNTGMRVGEIVNLTWPDVDLRRRVVKVRPKGEGEGVRAWRPKAGDLRDIPVNDPPADVLARHPRTVLKPEKQGEAPKVSPYVLHRTDGSPNLGEVLRQKLQRAGKRAGLSVSVHPHLLGHTFGTILAASGVDLDTIRRLMGHTDIKMTMRYLHAAPDRLAGAVQNLPFGRAHGQDLDTGAERQNASG